MNKKDCLSYKKDRPKHIESKKKKMGKIYLTMGTQNTEGNVDRIKRKNRKFNKNGG